MKGIDKGNDIEPWWHDVATSTIKDENGLTVCRVRSYADGERIARLAALERVTAAAAEYLPTSATPSRVSDLEPFQKLRDALSELEA